MVCYVSQGVHLWIIISCEYYGMPLNANTFYTFIKSPRHMHIFSEGELFASHESLVTSY